MRTVSIDSIFRALEWTMLIAAAVGLTTAALNYFHAARDLALKLRKYHGRIPAVKLFMLVIVKRASFQTLVIQLVIFGNGLWIVSHPPPPFSADIVAGGYYKQAIGNIGCWIVVTMLLAIAQVRGAIWRQQLTDGDYDGAEEEQSRRITDSPHRTTGEPNAD